MQTTSAIFTRRNVQRVFVKGLLAVLPISLTLFVLFWIGATAETALGGLLKAVLPAHWYVPGMGLAGGFVLVFAVGLLFNFWFVRGILRWMELRMESIPLVKTVFGSVRDLLEFMASGNKASPRKVVLVSPVAGLKLIGIVTCEDLAFLGPGAVAEQTVAVYVPMSYQVAGHTIFVPRSAIQPLALSVEDAMRFCLTAGMSVGESKKAS